MTHSRKAHSPARSTARKLGELGLAAPQVVAHRLTRMALAGPVLSARDRKEFSGMVQEKQQAFAQSWMAMWAESFRLQQRLWLGLFSALPLSMARPHSAWQHSPAAWWPDALARVAHKGLEPVHRKAVANSRRLAKTRLR